MRLIVLKLGGSLLACADLADSLRRFWTQLLPCRLLIVVGGGTAADVVRDWSREHSLPEETAHWLAVRSLTLTQSLVLNLLPDCREASTLADANRLFTVANAPVVLNVESYLRQAEPADADPLPHTWSVTSDSIAAWTAVRWSADELILLKSTGLPEDCPVGVATELGLVDEHFCHLVGQIPKISWCNLMDSRLIVQSWLEHGRASP